MLGSEYSWLSDYGADQQLPDYPLDPSTHTCTDGGDMLAGFDQPSVAQRVSTNSTIQIADNQQPLWLDCPALPVEQSIDFASLFADTSFSAPNLNLNPTAAGHDVGSLPAFQGYTPAQQGIDTESLYRNAASPLIHQHIDSAVASQGVSLFDTSAALSAQYTPDFSLHEELERSLLEEVPCVLEFGAELGTESRTESGVADKGPQLDHEQAQQSEERLDKQDERIRGLELALQQLQQQARPELPQAFIDIPRQWVEVQTNVEQYLKRFTDWAEEHSQANAGDVVRVKERVKELETEVRALRQCIDSSS